MKKLITLLSCLFFTLSLFTSVQAKDDEDVINKLSSFKASGADFS